MPQISIGCGLAATARTEVMIAVITSTSRSISNGTDTTEIVNRKTAIAPPMIVPTISIVMPGPLKSRSNEVMTLVRGFNPNDSAKTRCAR